MVLLGVVCNPKTLVVFVASYADAPLLQLLRYVWLRTGAISARAAASGK